MDYLSAGLPLFAGAWLAAREGKDPLQRTIFHWFEVTGLIALFGFFNVELDRFTWQFPLTPAP